jgi:hypothetical protein
VIKEIYMQRIFSLVILLVGLVSNAQDTLNREAVKKAKAPDYIWVFSSPKLINANTDELIPAGVLEFKVTHNFGDIAGRFGGIKNFFGLDAATDVRIGFQYGLSKHLNVVASRSKGAGTLKQLYEGGLKYRLMQQANDNRHPFSIAIFGNVVASAMKADTATNRENSFDNFSDRLSQTFQLLIARKFGILSLQLSPTIVHSNLVVANDDNTIFALGGALRLPVRGKFGLLVDYFHAFRSQGSKDAFKANGIKFYDALGVGVELLTEGHVFHLNFTNATEILENRFIPRTTTSWGKGQYRWGFTIARDFDLLWKKKHRTK